MAYISQIVVGGTTYDIRDRTVSGAMHFVGTTTSPLSDGATTKPIIVNGQSYTQDTGDVALYDGKEFVWDGTKWILLGDEGSYVVHGPYTTDQASAGGTIDAPIATITAGSTEISLPLLPQVISSISEDTMSVSSPITWSDTKTPSGTISAPTFTPTTGAVNISVKGIPNGHIDTPTFTVEYESTKHTHEVMPVLEWPDAGFTMIPTKYYFQPKGTVSTPALNFSGTATTTNTVLKSVTLNSPTKASIASVSGEVLTISSTQFVHTQGTLSPSYNNSVLVGGAVTWSGNPVFTGTTVYLNSDWNGATVEGTISQPTFHGDTTTFSGNNTLVTGGTVSAPTFKGDAMTISISKSLAAKATNIVLGKITCPTVVGVTNSAPTFHPTPHTHSITL